ncbi:MAG: VOC family protein [Cyanobacteria bacterium P01_F01_bin.86]
MRLRLSRFLTLVVLTASLIGIGPVYGSDRVQHQASLAADVPTAAWLAQAVPTEVRVQDVPVVGMTVADMDAAIRFYSEVLNFRPVSDIEVHGREIELLQGVFGARMRIVRLQLGSEVIELTEYLTPGGRPIPVDSRSNDLWFQHIAIVVSDMDAAYDRLRQFDVQHVSTGPQRLPETIPAAAGIEAFYFQDPDGHNLEIIFYPEGKGNPRWQARNGELFLGIDHTAIGIADTETSLQFYRDLLGLEVAGESFNFGTEQEHLNNVFGARLRISGLTADQGMAVEFLEYLSPTTGRPYPPDSTPADLWHWDITMIVPDAQATADRLQQANVPFISSGLVDLPESMLSFRRGFLVRDPDGHAIRVVEGGG